MNLRTLSASEVDYETPALPIALYPEKLVKTEGQKELCFARVIKNGTFDMNAIAEDMIASGCTKRTKQEILSDWHETCAAIVNRLINGGTVDAEIVKLSLGVKGLFSEHNPSFNRERNAIELKAKPTQYLKDILDKLECKIAIGNKSSIYIRSVYDVESESENKNITRGGVIHIQGKGLKLFGDDEKVGIYFVPENSSAPEIKVESKKILTSAPSKLSFIAPVNLSESEHYRMKIVSQYMGTDKARKGISSFITNNTFSII